MHCIAHALFFALAVAAAPGAAGRPAAAAGGPAATTRADVPAAAAPAELSTPATLEELFGYPYLQGTAPSTIQWSPDSRCVAFLWNERGERFRDLYIVRASGGDPERLTDVQSEPSLPIEEDERTPTEVALEELYDTGISQFDWSPDSKRIAFALRGDLYLVDTGGRARPTCLLRSRERESHPRFSPDGRLLAYVHSQNLWTCDLRTGALRQLTTLSRNHSVSSYPATSSIVTYEWAPDGSRIALMIWNTESLEDIVIPGYLDERVEADEWKRNYTGTPVFETEVGFVAREGGLIRWVDWGENIYYNNSETDYNKAIAWSPDSRELLINWNDGDYQQRRLYLVDAATMELKEIYTERQAPYFANLDALWSPDGRTIVITSERDGHRHIYAVPRAGGEARPLTRGDWDVLEIQVPEAGREIFFAATQAHPLERHCYAIPCSLPDSAAAPPRENRADRAIEGNGWRRLSSLPGSHHVVVSRDGAHAAARFSQFMRPTDLYLFPTRDPARERRVTRSPLPAFDRLARSEPEYFTFVNDEDGLAIHGFMVKPTHFDPARRYPAILSCVYANSAKNEWSGYDLLDHYMAEAMGYVVVRLDLRASEGHGRDFHYGYYQRMGLVDAGECVSAARHLRSLPYIDGERIGMWGSSYGGFLTLMTLFRHPGAFQAGAAWKPVTDWRNYTDDYTAQRLGRPEQFPEVYEATSPIHHVAGLADPLLIVHGMADDNVLFQDTVVLVQKLLEAGKLFDVMFYPKSNHNLAYWQENRVDLMTRTARFFRQHMGTGPAPEGAP